MDCVLGAFGALCVCMMLTLVGINIVGLLAFPLLWSKIDSFWKFKKKNQ